jgi:hypothetical protein
MEACPHYQSRSSEHARTIIGTIAHRATETRVDENELSDDDAAAVAECLDFYERRKQTMEWGHPRGAITELLETYLPIDDCVFEDGVAATTAGYVDRVIISANREYAELFDWKFGFWPVEHAQNNLQGIAYTLGLFRMFPGIQTAKFFFKQPLINSIEEATFTRANIPELYLRIQTVVARARSARAAAKLNDWSAARPTVPNCNFCANIGACHAVAEFACRVGSKFHPLAIPDNITPSKIHSPENTKLGLELAAVVAVWAKAYRGTITNRVIAGDAAAPPDHELVSKREREVVDESKYKETALKYLTESEFSDTLGISLTAVEKKISAKAPRGQKEATVDLFKQALFDAGAVQLGDPITFLKVKPTTKTKTE